MVLHVLADAAQFMHDRHADLREMLGLPTPDNCRICGEPIAPADRITSRAASARSTKPPRENSTPVARYRRWTGADAIALLARYREKTCCNDNPTSASSARSLKRFDCKSRTQGQTRYRPSLSRVSIC
jgi:hypothetical protein